MVIARMHESMGEKVLAACDDELLNMELKKGGVSVKISSSFYGENPVTDEEFVKMLNECTTANLFGEETISIAKKVYDIGNIIQISGVPHTQIFKIRESKRE